MENNMENNQAQQQTNNNAQQQDNGQQQGSNQAKMFTQDEVNQIVQSRLARYKGDTSENLTEREKSLNQRELKLEARERLADAGLPKNLIDAVNCNSKEEMEKSIGALTAYLGTQRKGSTYRVSTGSQSRGTSGESDEDIRKAMGLKGR